jgi:hypothetical protein
MSIRDCVPRLTALGITDHDARALRRIAMTLHRWHEMECGSSHEHASWCLVRGRNDGAAFEYDDNGAPFNEVHPHNGTTYYVSVPDRERGALKRLAVIMARYPALSFYVQTDPRGAPLYILRPGDVPEGEDGSAHYSRGIAVYK